MLQRSFSREWIETNGLGGYASSTLSGANTRRYHGLLVAATKPPVGRMVLLSKLDERLIVAGITYDLGTNHYRDAVHPRGFEHLADFHRDLFPVFDYAPGLRKTIAGIQGENTTVIVYESKADATLELRPFIAARDFHSLTHANDAIRRDAAFSGGVFSLQPYEGVPTIHIGLPGARFTPAPDWYYGFEYAIEIERGLEAHEDLFTPGVLTIDLKAGERCAVIVSTESPAGRDGLALLDAERGRREAVLDTAGMTGAPGRTLVLAADQFIVRRGTDLRTVIAGYHWFSDWGRDTMIALPGLTLATKRFDDARRILQAFAENVSEGMLPNRFPDSGEAAEYNTVDATLWFFVAARKYFEATGDEPFLRDVLLPVLRDIVQWHERGTRHGIHEDLDGLLLAGGPGDQLTWMDARVGEEVITPRHGKPVEIEALWFNVLSILADFEERWGTAAAARALAAKAARFREQFLPLFWNEELGCLYDVVDGISRDASRGVWRDASLRPNQLFAISLPYPLLEGREAERVLAIVEEKLLTPVGLRTLSPDDPRFAPVLQGTQWQRDHAYHQGTVWPWLLGPYITALVRLRGEAGIEQARQILTGIEPHLDEAGVGTLSEIFDGAPPHAPRGCVAQAWSVGEVLRVLVEELATSTP